MKHRARRLLIVAAMLPVSSRLGADASRERRRRPDRDRRPAGRLVRGADAARKRAGLDSSRERQRCRLRPAGCLDAGARRQILRQGMIVWFDAEGGTKRIGIHYPVVERGSGGEGRGGFGGYGGRRGREPGEHDPGEQQTPRARGRRAVQSCGHPRSRKGRCTESDAGSRVRHRSRLARSAGCAPCTS